MKKMILILLILSFGCQKADFQDNIHLKFIGLSISNYTKVIGKMPSNITDKEGKPLLSWRVELLRYLGDEELNLCNQFKQDEPWDSPHNLKVAQTVPFFYIDPKGPKCKPVNPTPNSILWTMDPKTPNYTPYLGVIGPKAAFRPGNSRNIYPNDNHAAIVVVDKSDVFWTEPRDISIEKAKKGDSLRCYGNMLLYLTARGCPIDWEKNAAGTANADSNRPPNYEYESDE